MTVLARRAAEDFLVLFHRVFELAGLRAVGASPAEAASGLLAVCATQALGTGLAGLAQRVRTVDGEVHVVSPAGGPTQATVTLPMHA